MPNQDFRGYGNDPRTAGQRQPMGQASGQAPAPAGGVGGPGPTGSAGGTGSVGAASGFGPQWQQSNQPPLQGTPAGATKGDNSKGSKPPKGGSSKGEKPKGKRGPAFWIAIVVAVVALVSAGFFAYNFFQDSGPKRNANGELGQLEGKTQEEIIAALNQQVEEGMLNIEINSTINMESGSGEADLGIGNAPNNLYMFNCVITDNDTGEVLYESGLLEPNYHIQRGHLTKALDAGSYPCTATFTAYDLETEEEIGKAAALVTILVKGN